MMNASRLLAFMFAVLFPTLAFAQNADEEKARTIKNVVSESYPSFIGGAFVGPMPTPATASNDNVTTETTTVLPVPEILIDDLESTTTWMSTRARMEPALEELNLLLLSAGSADEIGEHADKLSGDVELIGRMAPFQAPMQQQELAFVARRISRQIEYLVDDYGERDLKRLQSTSNLLRESMDRLDEILRRSDEDRGKPIRRPMDLPDDWEVPQKINDPEFANQLTSWRASELLNAYGDRLHTLDSDLRKDRVNSRQSLQLTAELSELARELARRSNEVPVASQVTFRNAALRLDVISENLFDFVKTEKKPYARRQIRYAIDTAERCHQFLAMREAGL